MLRKRFLKRDKFKSYEDYRANCRIKIPEDFNFAYDVVDVLASDNPKLPAIYWVNDKGEKKIFTFADVSMLSKKAANFWKKLGLKKGDSVMLILKSRHEFWINMMAFCRIGALAIPGTHLLTSHDIEYRVKESGAKAIVAFDDDFIVSSVDSANCDIPIKVLVSPYKENISREGWVKYDIENCQSDFPVPRGDEKVLTTDYMLGYFTSGTTAYPKLVIHDNTYPLGHINTAIYWHRLEKGDLHFTHADSGWGKCVWGKLYGQWIAEATVFVYDFDKFAPVDLLRVIDEHKITSFCAPPTIYRFLLQEDFKKYDLSSLTKATIAGEALNPEVFNQFKNLTGIEIKEGFGQTETTPMLACWPWDSPRVGSMGKPAAGWNVQVVDQEGVMCLPGETGEVVVRLEGEARPIGLFSRYHLDEATNHSMRDGFYHTGDVAYYDEDGFFWFVGRNDDVIKSSGYRIGPFEVESALIEHHAVIECAVTGVPDEVRGQSVKATIILHEDYKPGNEELKKDIQEFVKKHTAPYKYPRIVEFVNELPKTISGKIKRKDIREHDEQK